MSGMCVVEGKIVQSRTQRYNLIFMNLNVVVLYFETQRDFLWNEYSKVEREGRGEKSSFILSQNP